MKISCDPKRGHPERTDVDRFQAMAWFNSIAYVLNDASPTHLEQLIQPRNVSRDEIGKLKSSRAWDKYKIGARLPQDGYLKDGISGAVIAAERFVPESADVFRHPIWIAMRSPLMEFKEVVRLISTFPPPIAHQYMDLDELLANSRSTSLAQNIGEHIWIECSDFHSALDHLAAHLMFLRLDIVRHLESHRISFAYNIEMTLGPLAESPWIGPFHEEMFDWLEANIWGDLFDNYYGRGDDYAKGWRKTKPEWLLACE